MPSYIFEVSDDGAKEEGDPLVLPDDAAAREEALRAISEIMSGDMPNGDQKTLIIRVRPAGGRVVLTVKLQLEVCWHYVVAP